MKYLTSYLIATLLFCGCKNDSQKQREKQLETYEKLYEMEREKIDPTRFEQRLDSSKYEILQIKPIGDDLTNYYVLIKNYPLLEDSIRKFVQDFMHDHCVNHSNLFVVDDKRAHSLIGKYTNDSQTIFIGDHLIATASNYTSDEIFHITDEILIYPYQDMGYKKAGGKNWKKKPIE